MWKEGEDSSVPGQMLPLLIMHGWTFLPGFVQLWICLLQTYVMVYEKHAQEPLLLLSLSQRRYNSKVKSGRVWQRSMLAIVSNPHMLLTNVVQMKLLHLLHFK